MKCPMCGSDNITTVDSRSDHDSIVRRNGARVEPDSMERS